MTLEEARKEQKKWEKADIWICSKCDDFVVVVYPNKHSNQWAMFIPGVSWSGLIPVCSRCSSKFERLINP